MFYIYLDTGISTMYIDSNTILESFISQIKGNFYKYSNNVGLRP